MDGTSLAPSHKHCSLSAVVLPSCHLCCNAHILFRCGFFWLVMDAVVTDLVAIVMRSVAIAVSCHRDKCGCCSNTHMIEAMELVVIVMVTLLSCTWLQ